MSCIIVSIPLLEPSPTIEAPGTFFRLADCALPTVNKVAIFSKAPYCFHGAADSEMVGLSLMVPKELAHKLQTSGVALRRFRMVEHAIKQPHAARYV